MSVDKQTLIKRKKMQKLINKKYTKLWRLDEDNYENYLQFLSDFGTIVSLQGGFLMFLTNDEEQNLSPTVMHNKVIKVKAIQSLLSAYHFGKISKKKMLELAQRALTDADYQAPDYSSILN